LRRKRKKYFAYFGKYTFDFFALGLYDSSRSRRRARLMAKMRSPNYPRADLSAAIAMAKKVYDGQHTHAGAREVVASHLGYESLNGTSLTWIATLTSYGLLENVEGGLKVTDDAVTVIELPKGETERIEAVRRLAFTPKLFTELRQEFGDKLPNDVNLRHSLIKKKFLPKAADEAIRVYRETLEFVTDEMKEYNPPDTGAPEGQFKPGLETPMQPPTRSPHVGPEQRSFGTATEIPVDLSKIRLMTEDGRPLAFRKSTELAFKLSRGSEAKVTIYGDASQEAIQKLRALLELQEDTFPTNEEIAAQGNYRPATWRNKDHDQPVTVTGDLGVGADGRKYLKIAESQVGIPEDEVEFVDAKAKGTA
jgi:hypothetical protein